jgi:hypothetical protein
MKNFKEIAEKCLSGELSGTFIIRNHKPLHSKHLYRYMIGRDVIYGYYWLGGIVFDEKGENIQHKNRIQNFIPDNMQEQIKINIPEGKVPVMEQTEKGVVITWKEKELTYKDIESKIILKNTRDCIIGYTPVIEDIKTLNCPHSDFYKKVEVLRKLTNIRNYFGKPENMLEGWCIFEHNFSHKLYVDKVCRVSKFQVVFAKKEHAEQAIKMLGDELKYLFEPW